MSVFQKLPPKNWPIAYGDGPDLDAFGRLRVSNPTSIFDSKFVVSDQSLRWSKLELNGATVTWDPLTATVRLRLDGTPDGRVVHQTRQVFNYQPGKSQLVTLTGAMGPRQNGVMRRIGFYNDDNGLFFQQSGPVGPAVVVRSDTSGAVEDEVIPQAEWNLNKAPNLDLSRQQIFVVDFQWLGVGRVRFGFQIDGRTVYVHESRHANEVLVPYMRSPNLPVRYELLGGVAAELTQTCSSVVSEGGYNLSEVLSVDRGMVLRVIPNAERLQPLICARLTSGAAGIASVTLQEISMICTTNGNSRWALLLNPVFTTPPTYVAVSDVLEADRTNTPVLSIVDDNAEGILLRSGYFSNNVDTAVSQLQDVIALGVQADGTRDEFVLAAEGIQGASETYCGGLSYAQLL